MGSFPSTNHTPPGYIRPVTSRAPGYTPTGSKGSLKNTTSPLSLADNLSTYHLKTERDDGRSLSPHKTSQERSMYASPSAKEVASNYNPEEISSFIDTTDDNVADTSSSSILPEHSFQLFSTGGSLFPSTTNTSSRYSPLLSASSSCPRIPHLGSLPINTTVQSEIEQFSKKNKRSFSLDEKGDEQVKKERSALHSARRSTTLKMSQYSQMVNPQHQLPPPTLSITVSSPEELTKITVEPPQSKKPSEPEPIIYDFTSFKMGEKNSPKKKKTEVADIPDFSNFKLGGSPKASPISQNPKPKKVGFMGPLVDIIVHGGLGLPTNHKIRRHSYTPTPTPDLLENHTQKLNSPFRKQSLAQGPNQLPTPSNVVPPTSSPQPRHSKNRDLSKSVAEFVLPPPVDIEPSPKLFVATISKTRRMSLKDETAERLNDLLAKQRTDQFKV